MLVLVQILFALSITSFSLCLYFLLNEIKSTFVFKYHRKLIFTTFFVSLISGVLSCFAHGSYMFFILEHATLPSDMMTWFIFLIFIALVVIKILAKIFHWEVQPINDGIKGKLVKINKNDITIQAEVGPQFMIFVDKDINKQIGVWAHNGVTDYIVFSCTVDKSDMIADIYKTENSDVYFCDKALILGKDGIIKTLLKLGSWIARGAFITGMLLENYQWYYLHDYLIEGIPLPENPLSSSLIPGSLAFLLFSWIIQKFGKTKGLIVKFLCVFGWFVIIVMSLTFIMAIFDPSTYENFFTIHDNAGNVLHSLQ